MTTKGRVLLVSTNPEVRGHLVRMLEHHHFDVLLCETGANALAWLGSGPFDVLLTEVEMPGMSGIDLAKQVEVEYVDMKIMFIVGFRLAVFTYEEGFPPDKKINLGAHLRELPQAVAKLLAA